MSVDSCADYNCRNRDLKFSFGVCNFYTEEQFQVLSTKYDSQPSICDQKFLIYQKEHKFHDYRIIFFQIIKLELWKKII